MYLKATTQMREKKKLQIGREKENKMIVKWKKGA